MKRLWLTALGVAVALTLGAQTAPDEKQQPTEQQVGKTKTEENAKPEEGTTTKQGVQATERGRAQVSEKGATVSHSTTVFRNGRETSEHLSLHRNTREHSNVHFSIGTHPRDWWLRTYSIVFIDGCHYYLADDGCWYPAFGFDPSCNYPEGVVYCD
jgi:hypothetical protein